MNDGNVHRQTHSLTNSLSCCLSLNTLNCQRLIRLHLRVRNNRGGYCGDWWAAEDMKATCWGLLTPLPWDSAYVANCSSLVLPDPLLLFRSHTHSLSFSFIFLFHLKLEKLDLDCFVHIHRDVQNPLSDRSLILSSQAAQEFFRSTVIKVVPMLLFLHRGG